MLCPAGLVGGRRVVKKKKNSGRRSSSWSIVVVRDYIAVVGARIEGRGIAAVEGENAIVRG